MVPGHEIVGTVSAVGPEVSKFKVGDAVAIGVMVDSCRECEPCLRGDEIYCRQYPTNTYDGVDRVDGTLCSVGVPDKFELSSFPLAMGRRSLASSGAGGTNVTREMLDFCGKHNIVADIEMVKPAQISAAFERLEKADVRYRFVLDMRRG